MFRLMYIWIAGKDLMKPHKEAFYFELKLEDITDKDYKPAQKVWEVFGIKYLCE